MKSPLPKRSSFNIIKCNSMLQTIFCWSSWQKSIPQGSTGNLRLVRAVSGHYRISTAFYNTIIAYSYQLWQYSISTISSSFSHVTSVNVGQNNEEDWPGKSLVMVSETELFQGPLSHTHLNVLYHRRLLFSSYPKLSSFCVPSFTSLFYVFY